MLADVRKDAPQTIRNLFQLFQNNPSKYEEAQFDIVEIFRSRAFLNTSLDFHTKKIAETNEATFKFMTQTQRDVLVDDLLFSFYLLSADYALEKAENRKKAMSERKEQIKSCAHLIQSLDQSSKKSSPLSPLEQESNSREHPVNYLGLSIGQLLGKSMVDFSSGKTVVIKEWMGAINSKRLYWVWGGGLVSTVLSLLPEEFARKGQAKKAVSFPQPFTGRLSWMLYYARFGMNLTLLLKHTFAGSWMSVEESKIPMAERFKTQWDQRKFSLLNDSIWATANLACFAWLTGEGILGYYGNVLTAGLLLMDVCLCTWEFYEATTKHNAERLHYQNDIEALRLRLALVSEVGNAGPNECNKIKEQLAGLEKALSHLDFEWKYKKFGMINDLTYSVALLGAFTILCCFYLPPSAILPATAIALGVVGAALSFVFTVTTSAVKGHLEISKSKATRKELEAESNYLLNKFGQTADEPQKKFLYLEIKRLLATSDTKEKEIHYQQMVLIKDIFIKAFVPALVFSAFVFFPLNMGLGIIAAAITLALMAQNMIDKHKPDKNVNNLPAFVEEEYTQFLHRPTLATIEAQNNKHKFFGKSGHANVDLNEGKGAQPEF